MVMEWLRRIRISLPPLTKGSEQGTPYQMAKAAKITQSSYILIEKNGIGPRERTLIAAWRLSGKDAKRLLEDIEQEIQTVDEAKATSHLTSLKSKKRK